MPSYEEMMKILGKPKPKKTNKSTFNPREQAQKDSMSLELWKKKEAYKDSTKSEEVYEPTQKDIEFNAMLNEVYRQYEKKHNKPMSPELQNAVIDSITISQSGSNFKHMVPSSLKGPTKKQDKPVDIEKLKKVSGNRANNLKAIEKRIDALGGRIENGKLKPKRGIKEGTGGFMKSKVYYRDMYKKNEAMINKLFESYQKLDTEKKAVDSKLTKNIKPEDLQIMDTDSLLRSIKVD